MKFTWSFRSKLKKSSSDRDLRKHSNKDDETGSVASKGSAKSKGSVKSTDPKKKKNRSRSKNRVSKSRSKSTPVTPPTPTTSSHDLTPTPDYRVQAELDEFKNNFMSSISQDLVDLFVKKGEELADAGIIDWAVKEGDIAPHFCLPDQNGKLTRINELISDGPLVLTFYKGGWCPYCQITLKSLQSYLPKFEAKGAKLVAISPELQEFTANTAKDNGLDFPVLSDPGCKVGMDYGIDFVLDKELQPVYLQFGLNVPLHNAKGDAAFKLPIPATYVIDTDGSVLYSFVNTDYTQRAEPEDILQAIPDYKSENESAALHGSGSLSLTSLGLDSESTLHSDADSKEATLDSQAEQ